MHPLIKQFEDRSYKLARAEEKYNNHSETVPRTGMANRKEHYHLKKDYESKLSDVMMTIYQLNQKIGEFPDDKIFIKGLVEKYKKYDKLGLFD